MPVLTADQAETVLGRLREADYPPGDPLVVAALTRLEDVGGKRRANAARRWWADASGRDERRAVRQERGTVAEQKEKHRDYLEQLELGLEAATRGQMLKPAARERGVRTSDVLTMSPAAMRANLSEEALRYFGQHGPPLSFDAWRYANLGARDSRAVASWRRRTAGYFSEHG